MRLPSNPGPHGVRLQKSSDSGDHLSRTVLISTSPGGARRPPEVVSMSSSEEVDGGKPVVIPKVSLKVKVKRDTEADERGAL